MVERRGRDRGLNARLARALGKAKRSGAAVRGWREARLARQLAAAADNARNSFHLLQSVCNCHPYDIWVMDVTGHYVLQNANSRVRWGNLVGKTLDDIPIHAEMRSVWRDQTARALSGEDVVVEYEFIRDGRNVVARKTLKPLVSDGFVYGVLGTSTEITDTRELVTLTNSWEAISEAVRFAAACFLRDVAWEANLHPVLERLGQAADVSAMYVLKNQMPTAANVTAGPMFTAFRQWRAETAGVVPELLPGSWSGAGLDRWIRILRRGQTVRGVSEDFATSEQGFLERCGVASILLAPIQVDGQWWGCLCAMEHLRKRKWAPGDVDALQAAADILGAAIERAHRDEALRVSEWRWRSLAENAPLLVVTIDRQYRIEYSNNAIGAVSRNDLLGISALDFVPRETALLLAPVLARVFSTGLSTKTDLQMLDGDGNHRWFEATIGPLRSESRVEALILLLDDIDERKQTTELIEIQHTLVRELSNAENNEKALILFLEAALRITGAVAGAVYEPEEQESLRCVLTAGNPAVLRGLDESCSETKASDDSIFRLFLPVLHKDRELLQIELAFPERRELTGLERNLLDSISSNLGEVLSRMEARESLARTADDLSRIIENSSSAILAVDLSGRINEWNRKASQATGFSREEAMGRDLLALLAPRQTWPRLRRIFFETLGGDRVENVEVAGLCKDGSSCVFLLNSAARRDASGDFVGIVCFAQDISDRVQLEADLIDAESRERKRIGRDLHDGLGQEITGIQCLTRSLANRLEAENSPHTSAAQEIAELIRSAAMRARELARGLNPFRIDARSFVPALEELSNSSARTFGVPSFLRVASKASIQDDSTAEHLFRIAQQAVTNAVQHGKPNQIDIRFAFNGHRGVLVVADNGCGISESSEPGTGMGLRIMERRARIIGGSLEVRRRKEGGTKVICTFDTSIRTGKAAAHVQEERDKTDS